MKLKIKYNSGDEPDLPEATRPEPDDHGFANEWSVIEISTLEELLALSKRLDYALEVSDWGEPSIVIMDTPYR